MTAQQDMTSPQDPSFMRAQPLEVRRKEAHDFMSFESVVQCRLFSINLRSI